MMLNQLGVSAVVFACLFGGGLLGMRLRTLLPQEHLADESKHLLDTGLGVIGTIGGLVLGLLVGTSFGTYNTQRNSLVQMSANIVLLDRGLAHYGPEAGPARAALRDTTERILLTIWPPKGKAGTVDPLAAQANEFYDRLSDLAPKDDNQKFIKGQALGLAVGVAQTRWLMYQQMAAGISMPLLAILTFWFTITFIGLGIFTRPNSTVVTALCLAAIAVAGAVFILQEMYTPFQGAMQISSAPLQQALANLGKQ